MKVVTFGEIMLRLGAPDYLRLNQCNQFDISFAGAEANVAVSLANYGVKAEYITRLPKHPIADKCISELLSYRVDVSRVIRGGKRIGILSKRVRICALHACTTTAKTPHLLPSASMR